MKSWTGCHRSLEKSKELRSPLTPTSPLIPTYPVLFDIDWHMSDKAVTFLCSIEKNLTAINSNLEILLVNVLLIA